MLLSERKIRLRRWDLPTKTYHDEDIRPDETVSSFLPWYAARRGGLNPDYLTSYKVEDGQPNVDEAEDLELSEAEKNSEKLPALPACLTRMTGGDKLVANTYIVLLYKPLPWCAISRALIAQMVACFVFPLRVAVQEVQALVQVEAAPHSTVWCHPVRCPPCLTARPPQSSYGRMPLRRQQLATSTNC